MFEATGLADAFSSGSVLPEGITETDKTPMTAWLLFGLISRFR